MKWLENENFPHIKKECDKSTFDMGSITNKHMQSLEKTRERKPLGRKQTGA